MCGSGENVYGIIAGLVAAAFIIVTAFAEKHSGAHAPALQQTAQVVRVVSPVSFDIQRDGAHLDINLRF